MNEFAIDSTADVVVVGALLRRSDGLSRRRSGDDDHINGQVVGGCPSSSFSHSVQ